MLGERIKTLRLAHSLSQVELGSALSVTKQTVSNWENGYIQPSVDMLVRLADFFHTTADYLLGRDDAKTIDVSFLTDEQVAHIKWIIQDITGNIDCHTKETPRSGSS